jgi:hypothetical protein
MDACVAMALVAEIGAIAGSPVIAVSSMGLRALTFSVQAVS